MEKNVLESAWKTNGRFIFADNIIRLALGESDDAQSPFASVREAHFRLELK